MTEKQRELIEDMNEFCTEKCPLDADVQTASDYISRNIEEFKLLTMDNLAIKLFVRSVKGKQND